MGKATQDLRKEHDSILHVFKILDKMLSTDTKEDIVKLQYYNELVYFLKIFADKCHHGKEEQYLFVELINKGIPKDKGIIPELLKEHNQGREYINQMNDSLESKDLKGFNSAATKYRDLMRKHIEKENDDLFVIVDKLLDEVLQDELFEKFEQHEESVIGHGVHEKLHSMIHKWAEAF